VFVVAMNTIVIAVCLATLAAVAAVLTIDGRRRRRSTLERFLATTVAELYWPFELEIVAALRRFDAMRSTILFDEVSAFDVLVYKYRCRQHRRWQTLAVSQPSSLHPNSSHLAPSSSVGPAAAAGNVENFGEPVTSNRPNAIWTLEKIERLFDVLSIRLPFQHSGSLCPTSVAAGPFARTVSGLARETAAVWPDDRASAVRRLVAYFGGHDDDRGWRRRILRLVERRQTSAATIAFDAARASCCGGGTDASVECRIRSRLPYVEALRLSGWRFVLADVLPSLVLSVDEPNSNMSTIIPDRDIKDDVDVRSKVRFIDERLSRLTSDEHGGGARALSCHRWPELVAAYNEALGLAVGVDLVAARLIPGNSSHHPYPDFGSAPSPPLSTANDGTSPVRSENAVDQTDGAVHVVVLLRHLVRLMCADDRDALRRLECDERFAQFVTRLHEALYGWSEAPAATRAAVERCRANIIAYARTLTAVAAAERLAVVEVGETDSTLRRTLVMAESELYRHLDLLTRRRVELAAAATTRSRERKKPRRQEIGIVKKELSNDPNAEIDFWSAAGDDGESTLNQRPFKASSSYGRWLQASAATVSPTAYSSVSSLPIFSVGSEISVYTLAASHIASPEIEKIRREPRPEDVTSIGSSRSIRSSRDPCCVGDVNEDDGSLFSGGSLSTPYASLSPTGGNGDSLFQSFWGCDIARRYETSVDSPTTIASQHSGIAAIMGLSAPTTSVEFFMISSDDECLESRI